MPSAAIRRNNHLVTRPADGFSHTEFKRLERLQNADIARGLVTATRVQAAVAGIGLQATAMLSREASFQADDDPVLMN